jgi:cation/acetate symporter
VFGVPAGLAALAIVSLLTPRPAPRQAALVRHIRTPEINEIK